jgi:uncharacterized protein YggE
MLRILFLGLMLGLTGALNAADEVASLAISGTNTVTAEPDEGYITVGVAVVSETSAKALSQNTATMNSLYQSLDRLAVTKKDIRTLDFSVGEHFTSAKDGIDNQGRPVYKQVKDGYQVSNVIRVTVCDLSTFGKVLDTVVQDGANQVQQISFGSSKAAEYKQKARTAAIQDAVAKAKVLTEGLGVKLGRVIQISENSGRPPQAMYMSERSAGGTLAADVPVSGGTLGFSAAVSVRWELKQDVTVAVELRNQVLGNPLPE